MIVVGSLVPPFVSSDNDVSEASTDNPTELHHSYRFPSHATRSIVDREHSERAHHQEVQREKHAAEYPVNV